MFDKLSKIHMYSEKNELPINKIDSFFPSMTICGKIKKRMSLALN